jgi:2-polyprenyl-6-methoxyphenol hydroxylase-like FAD-dependent oxidoreductase
MNQVPRVLVVGAGPTGLMMAIELTRLGVPCRIIDKAPASSPFSKALGIQARTLEVFERIGIADPAVAAGRKLHGINVHSEGKRIVQLKFDPIASRYNFILVLPQSETERLLADRLAALGLDIERNVELVRLALGADGADVGLRHQGGEEEQLRVPWVIGCDGAHSSVRHLLRASFAGKTFTENFALADVRLDARNLPEDEITIYLCRGDFVGLFPMTGEHRFRIALERPEQQGAEHEPTLDEFQRALRACGHIEAKLSDPTWMTRFRISQRRVARYRQGRAFLAGDAAHIHSPAGGQGMNTGIQDACNLAWKLALVIHGRGRPELLDSYEQERQPLAEKLLRATGELSRAIMWRSPVAEAVRDRIASILLSFGPMQDMVCSALSELGINYRSSPLVQDHTEGPLSARLVHWLHLGPGPRAGDRAPDVALAGKEGDPRRLFELLNGTRHVALLFVAQRIRADDVRRQRQALDVLHNDFGDQFDVYVIRPRDRPGPAETMPAKRLLDNGALHREYGADDEVLYLIRPDGYIGYRSQPAAAGPLRAYLDRIFLPSPSGEPGA